jgi:division protein CdvB (Snf7/Vps24/ESCRT-III family)
MSESAGMSKQELIRMIGDVLTEIDGLSTHFNPGDKSRDRLDELRDRLDKSQRQLVKQAVMQNVLRFDQLTDEALNINQELLKTVNDTEKVTVTLETLVRFAGAVQEIAELAP